MNFCTFIGGLKRFKSFEYENISMKAQNFNISPTTLGVTLRLIALTNVFI